MMLEISKIKKIIKKKFKGENSGHDYKHLKRVYKYALKIQKEEGGDKYVISIAALVHDIHRIMSNREKRFVFPKESLKEVEEILIMAGVNKDKIAAILEVVEFHDEKCSEKEFNQEIKIIQDADVLDALGKRGLKRTLAYCKDKGIPVVDKNHDLDSEKYIPDVNPISTCHYIYRTMIPNGKRMHTNIAKKMAKNKIKVLETFLGNYVY